MRIRIEKINYGVTFTPVTKTGKPSSMAMGPAVRRALANAEEWYRGEVKRALVEANMSRCGYAHDFDRACSKLPDDSPRRGRPRAVTAGEGSYLQLEPVGFAITGPDGEVTMNDTGATASPGRAKILACYQGPLFKVPSDEPDCVRFYRFVNVDGDNVTPESKPRVAFVPECLDVAGAPLPNGTLCGPLDSSGKPAGACSTGRCCS
jgi:hypothetical protein